MKQLLYFLFFALLVSNQASAIDKKSFDKYFKLLPQPKKIQLVNGKGIPRSSIRALFLKGTEKPVLYGRLQTLPLTGKEGYGVVALRLSNDADLPESPEGYMLDIKNTGIVIRARSQAGLFYGCQTLTQLMEDAEDQNLEIPSCSISDYPDIAYRAIHLDLKHHLDVGKYYYDMMDRLAAIKINAVIVEFEDKLRYKKASVVGAPHAFSVEEFASISRYAKERNIEISPLVQGLGHASFILKHEKYKALRDDPASDWSFDPLKPETYDVQFSLYEDAIAATPFGKYLHIGGDEVGNLGQSELAKKSGLKPIELQMRWLQKVCAFAKLHNRIPIFWDDMLFKLAGLYETTYDPDVALEQVQKRWAENSRQLEENLNLFPKECIYMRWNYDTPKLPGNLKAIDWYKSHDLKVMAATAAQTMWPMLPREGSNYQSIKDFCKIAAEKNMDGILCTAWDDCSPHFETLWRGFYDFAYFSWNYNEIKRNDIHSVFRHRFYSPSLSDSSYNFQDQLEESLSFWETAVLDKGHRNNYPGTINLIELPRETDNGTWSKSYLPKLQKAKAEISRYQLIKGKISKATQLSRRNQYSLAVFNQINELQAYPSKVLLLLQKYDQASQANKKTAMEEIRKQVNNFSELRKAFENVYSETRMLNNPEGYIQDQNHHHHLANGTNNSDWMFVYEQEINKKLNNWLSE
jgi:hypothetical protein